MVKNSSELLKEIKKKKKKLPVVKNSKDIKDIVDPNVVDEVISELVADSKDKQQDKFLLLWLLGFSAKAAALSVGYSQSYSESGVQRRLKTPKLRQRLEEITQVMPEKYKSLCRLRLLDVSQVEGQVLEEMKKHPDKAMKHPQVLKQIKQSAGALADEGVLPEKISIGTLNVIQNQQREVIERRLEFMKESPDDISPEAFEVWKKKEGIKLDAVINVTPKPIEDDQEED